MTDNTIPPELEFAEDDDMRQRDRRLNRTRLVAWIVIGALILTGGGATVLALIFG
ncbi:MULTISPECIES: hypothetical protein [Microbacterium]|uniref:hypothetical protein n=1 Tax=Microbacterium TaxID=33882 RepID=UPI001E5B31FC|nr:hypothetical protein [Microbacterium nymphoidis]MCD2499960.1 hypothetical protein [Microbacterium nymphoidis]